MMTMLRRIWRAPANLSKLLRAAEVADQTYAIGHRAVADVGSLRCAIDELKSELAERAEAQRLNISEQIGTLARELPSEFSAQLSFSMQDLTATLEAIRAEFRSGEASTNAGPTAAEAVRDPSQRAASNAQLSSQVQDFDGVLKAIKAEFGQLKFVTEGQLSTVEQVSDLAHQLSKEMAAQLNLLRHVLVSRMDALKADHRSLEEAVSTRVSATETEIAGVRSEVSSSAANLHPRLKLIEQEITTTKSDLAQFDADAKHRFNLLHTGLFETKNIAIHLTTNFDARLNTFENELLPAVTDQIHQDIAIMLELRARMFPAGRRGPLVSVPSHAGSDTSKFETDLDRARTEFPIVYGFWRERLDAMRNAFLATKIGNAAHAGDIYSGIFRSFVTSYARGRLLDVGCGLFGVPYYLEQYPKNLISGIDPLEPATPPDFEFVQGISEYMPWADGTFATVISATALDHSLSLKRSLGEICRVLEDDGNFLLWIGSNPGSSMFDENNPTFAPADEFHLFHFDTQWFEPMLERYFNIVERIELSKRAFNHVFYYLQKKSVAADYGP